MDQEDGDVFADIFHTFTSIPLIGQTIQRAFSQLINRNTGQSYSSSSSERVDVPDIDAGGAAATPRAVACSDCFVCKVPEINATSLARIGHVVRRSEEKARCRQMR